MLDWPRRLKVRTQDFHSCNVGFESHRGHMTDIQTIKMADDFMESISCDRKKTTIRKGVRDYTLGPAVIESVSGTQKFRVFIDGLSTNFADCLPEADLSDDGFADVSDMVERMKRFYPDFQPNTEVTVVRFTFEEELI